MDSRSFGLVQIGGDSDHDAIELVVAPRTSIRRAALIASAYALVFGVGGFAWAGLAALTSPVVTALLVAPLLAGALGLYVTIRGTAGWSAGVRRAAAVSAWVGASVVGSIAWIMTGGLPQGLAGTTAILLACAGVGLWSALGQRFRVSTRELTCFEGDALVLREPLDQIREVRRAQGGVVLERVDGSHVGPIGGALDSDGLEALASSLVRAVERRKAAATEEKRPPQALTDLLERH